MTTSTTPYRGYTLKVQDEGQADMRIDIYYGSDKVDTTHAIQKAKSTIDDWHNAR